MRHAVAEKPPMVRLQKLHWPVVLIWLIPLAALVGAGFYLHDYLQNHGTLITVAVRDGAGLKPGQTMVSHLGVPVGTVETVELSADQKQVLVHVRLFGSAERFAEKGALFWTVRPQVSAESISGLGTIASGPYIEAVPGDGPQTLEFNGFDQAPDALGPGLSIQLHAVRLEHLQPNSAVTYRGFQVGVVKNIQLRDDGTGVNVDIFIQQRYAALARTTSLFWIVSGLDFKGGILTGVQMKIDSLRAILSGGIAFATPNKAVGEPAAENEEFPLYETPKPEWENWAPSIAIPPDDPSTDGKDDHIKNAPESVPSLMKKAH